MSKVESGWIIWAQPTQPLTAQSYLWRAYTINNNVDTETAFGDTANEAIGLLVGKLTSEGPALIREIHTRDVDGKVMFPVKSTR